MYIPFHSIVLMELNRHIAHSHFLAVPPNYSIHFSDEALDFLV